LIHCFSLACAARIIFFAPAVPPQSNEAGLIVAGSGAVASYEKHRQAIGELPKKRGFRTSHLCRRASRKFENLHAWAMRLSSPATNPIP
jgi:hypothetical protein